MVMAGQGLLAWKFVWSTVQNPKLLGGEYWAAVFESFFLKEAWLVILSAVMIASGLGVILADRLLASGDAKPSSSWATRTMVVVAVLLALYVAFVLFYSNRLDPRLPATYPTDK
jgi:hypothetical protein